MQSMYFLRCSWLFLILAVPVLLLAGSDRGEGAAVEDVVVVVVVVVVVGGGAVARKAFRRGEKKGEDLLVVVEHLYSLRRMSSIFGLRLFIQKST